MRLTAFPSPGRVLRLAHHCILTFSCLLLLVAVGAGCATVGAWQQEGKTEQQLKTDEWDCAREVQSLLPFERTTMFRVCMGARGWKEGGR